MDHRDPGSDPGDGSVSGPHEARDVELAAAAASEQAAAVDAAPPATRSRSPKRWMVVTAVALTAVALATTATALAVRKPHTVIADTGSEQSPAGEPSPSDASTPQPDTDGASTAAAGSSSRSSSSSASTSSTKPSSAPTRSTGTPSGAKPSSPAVPVGTNETDCENSSHETPQDAAMKFTGMTKGTQKAFLSAQAPAKEAGLTFTLNSGYRSAAYQQRIFDCWVRQLGSAQAARQYALPANQSAHVAGYAMDIAPQNAAAWLEASAGKFGLCRRYADEPWHFEYQPQYRTHGCPALLPHP